MKLRRLEALRGLAAFYVVLHHSLPHSFLFLGFNVGMALRFGQEAVIVFFVLSGFVINYAFRSTKDKSFTTYFRKRFIRIYVPLVPVLIVSYLLAASYHRYWVDPSWVTLGGNLLMLQDVLKPGVLVYPYMGNLPLWSLSYEWWFYMMYFPLTKSSLTWQMKGILVWTISIAAAAVYIFDPNAIVRVLMYFSIWWSGVFLSELYCRGLHNRIRPWLPSILSLSVISLILCYGAFSELHAGLGSVDYGLPPVLEARHFTFSVVATIGAFCWSRLHWWGFSVLVAPFAAIAPISYALYISHYPLLSIAGYLSFIPYKVLEEVLYVFILIGFCWLLEIQLYPFINKIIQRRRTQSRSNVPI